MERIEEPEELEQDPVARKLDQLLRGQEENVGVRARAMVAAALDDPAQSRARLLALIDTLEGRAFDISRALALRGLEEGRLLSRALMILDAVRDVGLPAIRETPTDVLAEIDREEKWVSELGSESELSSESDPDRDAALRDQLDVMVVTRLEALADAPTQNTAPGAALRVISESVGDLMTRKRLGLVERLASARAQLWRNLFERARDLEGRRANDFLRQLADEINDRAEDVLARSESLPYAAAVRLLGDARRDVRRALGLSRRMRLQGRRRELRRMGRRVRAAIQDRRIRARQVAQVGPKVLRVVEVCVFLAIIAVLGILCYDTFGDPTDERRMTLAWVDAGICAFFLIEFSWRWAISRFSKLYLWRCFFIDVLPSLPFGLIAELGRGDGLRVLRSLRLMRLLRSLRLMRPLFQIYRILAFALQGMDRLARRNAALLNRNIVVFDPPEEEQEGSVSTALRLKRFRDRINRALRLTLSELPPDARLSLVDRHRAGLQWRLDNAPHCDLRMVTRPEADLRDLRVEAAIEELLSIEPTTIEVHLGEESAGRLSRLIHMLDVPIVRRLPVLRDVVAGTSRLDPYQTLARAGQGLGRFLDRLIERFRFFGDLTGIVTGSQMLDRIGSTLVRATQRPAVRLLMFGFGALLVSWLIDFFDLPLGLIADFLGRVLGTGVIVLGAVCLGIQAFGRWVRHLAGEATELYEKVAEAQGINLLKFHKLGLRDHDLQLIFDRTLAAEVRIHADDTASMMAHERRKFAAILPHEAHRGAAAASALGTVHEHVLLLYLDYLDGAILHRSNVKSTEQFLGNLEIEAIRHERLALGRRERKRLKKLDLKGDRPIPTGPYLWFRFITESLTQRVARLVLHYNRTAVPVADRELVPLAAVQHMQEWLAAPRRHTTGPRPALKDWNPWWLVQVPDRPGLFWSLAHAIEALNLLTWPFVLMWVGGRGIARGVGRVIDALKDHDEPDDGPATDLIMASRFNALHFMTADVDRDEAIEREFGSEVRERMEHDRREMVREVFSSYPFELMPRHRRTFNPYTMYFAWLGRGKVVLLPFRILWAWVRWWWGLLRAFGRLIRDQLRPEEFRHDRKPRMATLDVALRKINRMHLPVYMAALEMRMRFDPEYSSLRIPGGEVPPMEFGSVREDLDLIGAREYRRESFRERRLEMQRWIRALEDLLTDRGWPERPAAEVLDPTGGPVDAVNDPQAVRAVSVAWCIDYQDCRTLLNARRDIDRAFESFLAKPGDTKPRKHLWIPGHERRFTNYVAQSPFADRSAPEKRLLRAAYAANRGQVRTLIKVLEDAKGPDAAASSGIATLAAVARYPAPWTQQLVTLRTVQTLTCLDILNSRRVVTELGGYGAD
ncbi:MAG: hypothetical protein CMJ83_00750 [Planctomycetes bacterium]|nr:hypothetical protein [Planctomycetota bacterium]